MINRTHGGHILRIAIGITMLALLLVGVAGAATTVWDDGSGSPLPFTWNYTNFDGFNISGIGTESLQVLQTNLGANQRTIDKSNIDWNLIYSSQAQAKMLRVVSEWYGGNVSAAAEAGLNETGAGQAFDGGNYYIIDWQAQRYVALNSKVDKLTKLIIEQETMSDIKTLQVGETWNIGDGWAITANSIDTNATPRQAWLTLSKDGVKKDDKIVSAVKPIYTYVEKSIAGESDAPLFVTFVDIIRTAGSDRIQLRYTWAISTSVTRINSSDIYGVFMDAAIDQVAHTLNLKNSDAAINLTRNSTQNLMGNLAFRVEDTSTLRFYPTIIAPAPTPPTVHITANPNTHDINVSTNFTFTANPSGSWGNNISYSWSIAYEKCSTAASVLTGQSISEYLDVGCGNATISVIAEDEKKNNASDTYLVTVHENVTLQPTPPTFNISGFKINNATGSRVQGWNIILMNTTMQKSMLTGADGSYIFMNLVNGTYSVTEEMQAGWTNVSPMSQQVTINGADTMNINFTNQKTPIILIPGIMGSELGVKETFFPGISCKFGNYSYNTGDMVWPPLNFQYANSYLCNNNYLDVMEFNKTGEPIYPQVDINGKILDAPILGPLGFGNEPYYDTVRYLEDAYTPDINLFIFPYDFRKDIRSTIGQLDSLVDNAKSKAGAQKVNIIAHSMGGLVAREYIRDANRAKKVNTLVELGTPNLGSVDFLAFLLYNKPFGPFGAVNGYEANNLVQNWTGAFELLPSKKYYELYSDSNEYPFNDSQDIDNNKQIGPLNYDQLKILLTNLNKNMYVFNNAEKFHEDLDQSYSNTNGVNVYLIAGSGTATRMQIRDYKKHGFFGDEIVQDATSTNGDGTVPLKSATLNQTNNVYYVKQEHLDLPSNNPALIMAVNLLNGKTELIDGVKKDPFPFNGSIISVYSPVNLHAYDALNNHVGITSNGTVEETNISGSTYDELGESKFIYLPDGGHYRITTNATGEGSFDLKIRTYKESVLQREVSYLNVNQTNQTTTSMSLDSDAPILYVDRNGDGKTIQQLPPTSITDYRNTTQPSRGSGGNTGSSGGGSGGGGGGGGGGGTSGENYSNIEVKEKYDLFIFKDKLTSYTFNHSNPILSVNITGNVNAGETTATVEVLRNTSSLINYSAPGKVYKNVNIWVGTSGFAVPKNIKEAVITFRVENSWLDSNNLESSDITLVRWNGSYWNQLETSEIIKDSTYAYYEAKTYAFSPFAIKGISKAAMPSITTQSGIAPTATATPADTGTPPGAGATPSEGTLLMNWSIFIVVFAMVGIIIAVHFKRKGNFKK